MQVLALNGSPRAQGNTHLALRTVCEVLEKEGIQTEIMHIGHEAIRGCMACFSCANGQGCAHADGDFRARTNAMYAADGILIGSPVYYSAISGTLKSFLDRAFFSSKGRLRHKIAASVAVARRAGAVSTFDQINHYFLISEMVIAPAQYWNVARGLAVGDVLSDAEGISIFRNLGKNMAWLLKMREAASAIRPPEAE